MKHQQDSIIWEKTGDHWTGTTGEYQIDIAPEVRFRTLPHLLGLDLPPTCSFRANLYSIEHRSVIHTLTTSRIQGAVRGALKAIQDHEEQKDQRESALRQGWEMLDQAMGTDTEQ